VFDKYQELLDAATKGQWSPAHTTTSERLNQIIMEAMLYMEREHSKWYTECYEWSPQRPIQAEEGVQFWSLPLKRSKGGSAHSNTNLNMLSNTSLPSSLSDLHDLTKIVKHFLAAMQNMHCLKKSHMEHREMYLVGLAEAIVLKRHPHLEKEEQAPPCRP
jgi:hypothetical protein